MSAGEHSVEASTSAPSGDVGYHVFVCSAGEDAEFADRLAEALEERGRSVATGSRAEIADSDTFGFVLSAHSVASERCLAELTCALEHNKRIVAFVRGRDEDLEPLPRELASARWVRFDDDRPFDQVVEHFVRSDRSRAGPYDVFVCYARKDKRFVSRLVDALEDRDRNVFLDSDDIPPGMGWREWVCKGIEDSHTFAFVLSPHSVGSEQCREEIRHAVEHNKRIVTILRIPERDVDAGALARQLTERQWVPFTDDRPFEIAFGEFLVATTIDFSLIKEHTHYLALANRWNAQGRTSRDLLKRDQLKAARAWRARQGGAGAPPPTPLQAEFVQASEARASRLRRVGVGALALGFVAAVAVAAVAIGLKREADSQRAVATSRELAATALFKLDTDPELSLLLAREAMERSHTALAEGALRESVAKSLVRARMSGGAPQLDAAFSPDDRRVVTAGSDGTVRLWRPDPREEPQALSGHVADVVSAEFSPDGRSVVTASWDGTGRIWDGASGEPIAVLEGHAHALIEARFSPDGETVATASQDGTVRLWDAGTGEELSASPLRGHRGAVYDVNFSPDGRRLVSAGEDGTARVWTLGDGARSVLPDRHGDTVWTAEFSPDGERVVTASEDKTARLWTVSTGDVKVLDEHYEAINNAHFSPDGVEVVTAGDDTEAVRYDARTGAVLDFLRGSRDSLRDASYSPDGQFILTAGVDRTARIWDLRTNTPVATLAGHADSLSAASFSGDGAQVVTASDDGTVRVWDALPGRAVGTLREHRGSLADVEVTRDGRRALTVAPRAAVIWDLERRERLEDPIKVGGHILLSGSFGPEGRSAVVTGDKGLARVYDLGSGDSMALNGLEDDVWSAKFSPDGRLVATASRAVRFWDARTGRERGRPLTGHSDFVYDVAFSPDGRFVITGGRDKTVRIWSMADRREVTRPLRRHTDAVTRVAFSPDGQLAVTASTDSTAHVWDTSTWRRITELGSPGFEILNSSVNSAAFSPDSRFVVTASSVTVTASSVDVATGDRGGRVRLWDARSGRNLGDFTAPAGQAFDATFASGGDAVVTANTEGPAQIFACDACLPLDRLLDLADRRITRPLTGEEKRIYLQEG